VSRPSTSLPDGKSKDLKDGVREAWLRTTGPQADATHGVEELGSLKLMSVRRSPVPRSIGIACSLAETPG
jgi:hypothetical protein